jgi:PAS domain S-box-containing protein
MEGGMLEHADQAEFDLGLQITSVLAGSDLSFWHMLEKLPAGAYACDPEGLITYFNPYAVQLWGRAPALHDPVDRFCGSFKLFLPDGSPLAHDACWMALALQRGKAYNGHEIIIERPDGQHLTALAHANPIFDKAGRLLGGVNVLVDITERKRTEQALKDSEERLRLALDAGGMGTWEVDLRSGEGQIDANEAAILGLPSATQCLRMRDFLDLVHPDDRNVVRRQQALARRGSHFRAEFRILRPDNQVRWLVAQGNPRRDAAGQPYRVIGVTYDITARKQIEEAQRTLNVVLEERVAERTADLERAHDDLRREMAERHRMHESLFQREKLAALGTLLANVAHELNNPLAVAAIQLDNLQEDGIPDAWVENLDILRQSVERCKSVVQSFLALTRQQTPTRCAVALHAVIDDVLVLHRYALEVDSITLHLDLPEDLPQLWADPHQLHHVITNLIANSHHALRQTPLPRRLRLTAATNADQSQVTLAVADTGPGIPEELQRRIFEPFFTTKSQGIGSGLGLPLCRNIMEGHGGSMSLVSQPGHGTTFCITLPVANLHAQALETVPTPAAPAQAQRGTILLIDDEAGLAKVLTRLLQRSGHDVIWAANGQEGLAALEARSYDVILCDMRMPDLDGAGFYRELERRRPHLLSRVVFLTGDVLSPDLHGFFEQVKSLYLTKPFKAQEVRQTIQQVLETR